MPRETLADLLLTGPLPPEHGARIGRELALALGRAARTGRWPRVLRPDLVEVDPELRPILTDLVPREPDLPALGVVLRALLGEGDPVPLVLQVVTIRARQGRYRTEDQVARALELWLASTAEPAPRRAPWLRPLGDRVRPAILAVGLVITALGSAHLAAIEREPLPRSTWVVPPGTWAPAVPLEVEGVLMTHLEADALLERVARDPPEDLRAAGLSARSVDAILAQRPFATVEALASAPGVGPRALEGLLRDP